MIFLSTRCFSSRSEIPVLTRRLIPFAQNSLLSLSFLLFTLWLDNDVSLTSKRCQQNFNMFLRYVLSQFFIAKCFKKLLLFNKEKQKQRMLTRSITNLLQWFTKVLSGVSMSTGGRWFPPQKNVQASAIHEEKRIEVKMSCKNQMSLNQLKQKILKRCGHPKSLYSCIL